MNLTTEQARIATDQIISQRKKITRCTLGGGEPLLNPHLQGIINEFDRLPGLKLGRVLTNDLDRVTRATIELPPRWKWVPAPLDDPNDRKSGKAAHVPFLISPKDHGLTSTWDACSVRGYCGKGLDAYGFSQCGVAAGIGRILGIDPYWHDGPQATRKIEEICSHCPYGMSRKQQRRLTRKAMAGKIETISPTFQEGLKRHRESPMEFERYGTQDISQSPELSGTAHVEP